MLLYSHFSVAQVAVDNKIPENIIQFNSSIHAYSISQERRRILYKNFQYALEYETCNGARNFSFSSRTKLNALPLGLLMGCTPEEASQQHIGKVECN